MLFRSAKMWKPPFDVLQADGFTLGMTDNSKLTQAFGGQIYPNIVTAKRNLSLTLNLLDEDEILSNYWRIARLQQQGKDIIIARWKVSPKVQIIRNKNFELWTGVTSAPAGWTLSGANATVARSSESKFGRFSAAVTRVDTNFILYQDIHSLRGISYWQGKKIWFGAWVKHGNSRLAINDGVGTSVGGYPGSGDWTWLSISRTIDGAATQVRLQCEGVNSSNNVFYFDGIAATEDTSIIQTTIDYDVLHHNILYGLIKDTQTINVQAYKYLKSKITVEELI